MFCMRRREFITLLGGTAATWPLAAHSQQPAMPVIGLLVPGTSEADAFRVSAFRQGLNETGYVEGRNVAFEYRWAEDHYDRLPALATELARSQVAVMVALNTNSALAAKAASATIPIVFVIGADPVKLGLVTSLNRPGANVTGISVLFNVIVEKQFEILQETVPMAGLIGLLVNPTNSNTGSDTKDAQAAALALGQKMVVVKASEESELEAAFATLVKQQAGALLVAADVFLRSRIDKLVALTARHQLPMLCPWRECPTTGGLMSYGASVADGYRLQGVYAGRILKGEKPADLPVQQAVKVELVINLKTAKALGLTMPTALLVRADEVIE
jgi:putative tryptophan/tyrosine transport system substrate-binding protein